VDEGKTFKLKTAVKVAIAWFVGFVIYMVAAIWTGVLDGFPGLLCQPVMAFGSSGLFVALAFLVRLPLRILHLERYKSQLRLINIILLIIGVVLPLFSQQLGFTYDQYYLPSGESTGPHPITVITGYFMIIFSIINW
jgi:hypothetical protein